MPHYQRTVKGRFLKYLTKAYLSLTLQLNELIQENAMLKGKMVSMGEHLNKTNLETKASRETIMRLVSEVGREQRVATQYTTDMENLRLVSQ